MARARRQYEPGGIVHLTAGAVDDRPLFHTDLDRVELLALLRSASKRIDWQVVTWCLMTTHYHLLVALGRQTHVARTLQWVNGAYARSFNARYGRRGHLFRARYGATAVATDEHLEATIAYVLENPLRAGLVRDAHAWRWSGLDTLAPRPPSREEESLRLLRRKAA